MTGENAPKKYAAKTANTTNRWKKLIGVACVAAAAGMVAMMAMNWAWVNSSKDESCMACHVHPHAEASWRQSVHFNNGSGSKVGCAECHLPPRGSIDYVWAKLKTGGKDVMSYVIKDPKKIDWEAKGELEYARGIVYNESCVECHHQLFPEGISDNGIVAHLHWEQNAEKLGLNCIDCHLDAGHYDPDYSHARLKGIPVQQSTEIYTEAARVQAFENFTETIPGTGVKFDMRAIPQGTFTMGSPEGEKYRTADEAQREVTVGRFFMAATETTWTMYWAFLGETMSEGRIPPAEIYARNSDPTVDAISGPTPPFGNPEQGWGGGERPAITMTYYAAETFCRWLSLRTGKKYRLPTEAEWEWAARGGTEGAYFFAGDPKRYSRRSVWNRIFGADTTTINSYVVYAENSGGRTGEPARVKPNPWGLRNMSGNVWEYTSDAWGEERVIRGGAYGDDAAGVRVAVRAPTQHENWLRTDPQQPKSIWWYSDVKAIGFRVCLDY